MLSRALIGLVIGLLLGGLDHLFSVHLLSSTDLAIHLVLGGIGALTGLLIGANRRQVTES